MYILTKEEGGRHTPFFTNYHPQFYFRTTDVTGTVALPEGTEMVMPGDNTEMTVELGKPIAMDEGLRFAIREGGRTVGSGRVVKIMRVTSRARSERVKRHAQEREARQDHPRVRGLQAAQLHHDEEPVNDRERIEMKKYCRWDKRHTVHKETR